MKAKRKPGDEITKWIDGNERLKKFDQFLQDHPEMMGVAFELIIMALRREFYGRPYV